MSNPHSLVVLEALTFYQLPKLAKSLVAAEKPLQVLVQSGTTSSLPFISLYVANVKLDVQEQ